MIWKAALVALFAFAVALVVLVMSRSSKEPDHQAYNQSSGASAQQNADQNESWEALWQKTKTDPVAFFTLVLAVSTTALFCIGIVQIGFLISANKSATRAATAAEDSAKTSKEALISVQRAFVSISTFENVVINQDFHIQTKWENSGSTAANPFRNYVNWKVSAKEAMESLDRCMAALPIAAT